MKNLSSTVELLAVATHSDAVAQWDGETLTRAFHWARYCEHVYHRFHSNTTIRRVMETQLQLTNEGLKAVFPEYTELSFNDLPRCQHMLMDGLLHNADVPMSIMKILFDSTQSLNNAPNQDIKGLCSSVIQCKSASKVLDSLPYSVGADAMVQGELLLEKLEVLLKQSNGAQQAGQLLDSVLQDCDHSSEHFCPIIASSLLTKTCPQTDFILDWLLLKHTLLQYMCRSLPTQQLATIAETHVKFKDMYIDVLKKWATDMEYDVNNSDWFQVSKNSTISFQKLTEHFVSLCKASVSLKEHTETELKELKFSDGDFDVRGLSIWGDLLSETHKEMP